MQTCHSHASCPSCQKKKKIVLCHHACCAYLLPAAGNNSALLPVYILFAFSLTICLHMPSSSTLQRGLAALRTPGWGSTCLDPRRAVLFSRWPLSMWLPLLWPSCLPSHANSHLLTKTVLPVLASFSLHSHIRSSYPKLLALCSPLSHGSPALILRDILKLCWHVAANSMVAVTRSRFYRRRNGTFSQRKTYQHSFVC